MLAYAGCHVEEAARQRDAVDADLPAKQQPADAVQHSVLFALPKDAHIPV